LGDIFNKYLPGISFTKLRPKILVCSRGHEGKIRATCAEEGVISLADGLDCDHYRVQPAITPEIALKSDKSPIHYFGCVDMKKVIIGKGINRPLSFEFRTTGHAAALPIETFIRRLSNSTLENMAEVHITWDRKKMQLWPKEA
jgi:metal-dependent HD superfamily phosphatase/phosphodiesterase